MLPVVTVYDFIVLLHFWLSQWSQVSPFRLPSPRCLIASKPSLFVLIILFVDNFISQLGLVPKILLHLLWHRKTLSCDTIERDFNNEWRSEAMRSFNKNLSSRTEYVITIFPLSIKFMTRWRWLLMPLLIFTVPMPFLWVSEKKQVPQSVRPGGMFAKRPVAGVTCSGPFNKRLNSV